MSCYQRFCRITFPIDVVYVSIYILKQQLERRINNSIIEFKPPCILFQHNRKPEYSVTILENNFQKNTGDNLFLTVKV